MQVRDDGESHFSFHHEGLGIKPVVTLGGRRLYLLSLLTSPRNNGLMGLSLSPKRHGTGLQSESFLELLKRPCGPRCLPLLLPCHHQQHCVIPSYLSHTGGRAAIADGLTEMCTCLEDREEQACSFSSLSEAFTGIVLQGINRPSPATCEIQPIQPPLGIWLTKLLAHAHLEHSCLSLSSEKTVVCELHFHEVSCVLHCAHRALHTPRSLQQLCVGFP